jgi:anti-sigma regulatory factor (Ser/Thr protein kinase)
MSRGLDHRAVLFDGAEQFVDAGGSFVRDGLRRDEPVWMVSGTPRMRSLLEALGDDGRHIDTTALDPWYSSPARMITMLMQRMGREATARGGPWIIGEVPVVGADAATRREWVRYEALVNHALAGSSARLLCLYDSQRVEQPTLADARRNHPVLHTCSGLVASTEYTTPEVVLRELHSSDLDAVPVTAAALRFDDRPSPAREFVTGHAREAGLAGDALDDLRVAATEIITNAILHGRRPHWISFWVTDGGVICEVADGGLGVASPLAGHLVPDVEAPGGRGLWIARQLCDRVEISGARVRLHMGR